MAKRHPTRRAFLIAIAFATWPALAEDVALSALLERYQNNGIEIVYSTALVDVDAVVDGPRRLNRVSLDGALAPLLLGTEVLADNV